ncbi:hypothetical protein [Deinococcus marmoris]|uniref:Spore coat protein U domain-containing protein n=1 Tax=Deinococcus marmoris TaxID=249408 RepID=A0A1U7P0D8_9DEIO|nr:hypothetical protein [Deinococcus marmoris]OLV18631.1 hypothetical protein BOO71_0005227 [Deinococcus marmoris]
MAQQWRFRIFGGGLLACWLLGGAAQAACGFGVPVSSALDTYGYVQDWTQNIQVPVSCDGGSVVSAVQLSSVDGTVDLATNRFLGVMRSGSDPLTYFIPDATQLRVLAGVLSLNVTVPGGQWGAPTGTYTDTLTVTVEF